MYSYIPKELETDLKIYQDQWLSASPDRYMVITGHYKQGSYVEGLTTIKNEEDLFIPNGYVSEEGLGYSLVGFILEYSLQNLSSEFITILENTPEIIIFNNTDALKAHLNL